MVACFWGAFTYWFLQFIVCLLSTNVVSYYFLIHIPYRRYIISSWQKVSIPLFPHVQVCTTLAFNSTRLCAFIDSSSLLWLDSYQLYAFFQAGQTMNPYQQHYTVAFFFTILFPMHCIIPSNDLSVRNSWRYLCSIVWTVTVYLGSIKDWRYLLMIINIHRPRNKWKDSFWSVDVNVLTLRSGSIYT